MVSNLLLFISARISKTTHFCPIPQDFLQLFEYYQKPGQSLSRFPIGLIRYCWQAISQRGSVWPGFFPLHRGAACSGISIWKWVCKGGVLGVVVL